MKRSSGLDALIIESTTVTTALCGARKKGIKDPIVTCHNHGISIAYSKLSYTAMMALDAGLDTGDNCLLLCK